MHVALKVGAILSDVRCFLKDTDRDHGYDLADSSIPL